MKDQKFLKENKNLWKISLSIFGSKTLFFRMEEEKKKKRKNKLNKTRILLNSQFLKFYPTILIDNSLQLIIQIFFFNSTVL